MDPHKRQTHHISILRSGFIRKHGIQPLVSPHSTVFSDVKTIVYGVCVCVCPLANTYFKLYMEKLTDNKK